MDSTQQEKHIATDKNEFLNFDSSDFSSKLVHVHTEQNESPLKSNLVKEVVLSKKNKFDGARLLSSSEYKELKNSTTSFNKWFSQTTLLSHLVEEASPVSTNSSKYLKKDSFFLEGDVGSEDEFYDEYRLFFDKSNDGNLVNKSVVTFLMSNFTSPDDYKHVTLEQGMSSEFNDFKLKFLELLNDESNELKFKRALLTVAFNHYGCSVVKKFMTLDEYNSLLKVHKVFQSESMPKFVFDSMDRKYKSMLTLNEFVSGMLSCSPEANHNLNTSFGKLRLQHIFRAYDLNRLGYLHQHSLDLMLNHLSQLSNDSEYFSNLEELSENLLSLFNGKLSYDSFFYCIEHDVLKDTRFLFRSNQDMAKSVKDFLVNALNHVLPGDKPKQKVSPLFNRPSLDSNLSEQTPKDNPSLNRDFTFGNYSEKTKTYDNHYDKLYENNNYKTSNSPVSRHSIWSHTPRVYSEFTNNNLFGKDSMYNVGYGNNWSKSNYSSQTQKPQNPIDRVTMLYNDQENELSPGKVQTEYRQKFDKDDNRDNDYTKDDTHKNTQVSESNRVFEGQNPQRSVERTPEVVRQDSEDLFVDTLDSKPNTSVTGNSKLDELLKEYNIQTKTPEKVGSTENNNNNKPFVNLKDVDLFEDVFEDESQLLGLSKDTSEVFTPCENTNRFTNKETLFELGGEYYQQNQRNTKLNECVDKQMELVEKVEHKQNNEDKEMKDLVCKTKEPEELKTKNPVNGMNEPFTEMKTFDDPVGDDGELNLKGTDDQKDLDKNPQDQNTKQGVLKSDLDKNAVTEPEEYNVNNTKDQNVLDQNNNYTTTNVVEPDTGCSGPFSKPHLHYSTLESLTNQLSKLYKSKFLIFKGLLTDDTVPRSVFTKFLSHSLGDSTDHNNLDLCTFSDMLQLCDSVCSLLRKEDSLLELKGDFQVFASMNGDLSCVLDFFNTYGWPMVKKKVLDELVLNPDSNSNLPLHLKNNNWVDFDHPYLFMGGFVSDLSSVSLEFVMLMFSLKVLFPYHVYFLRSNKDERSFTNDAGFYDEVYRKLSQNHSSFKIFNDETFVLQCSKELFHRVNDVFEFMSVAAVLNNNVLCVDRLAHNFTYSKLTNLPKPLSLSNCDQEQVYDLLFNRTCSLSLDNYLNDHNLNNMNNNNNKTDQDNNGDISHYNNHNHVNSSSQNSELHLNSDSVPLTNDLSSSIKSHTLYNSDDFNLFKLVLCSSDELDSGYKQLMNNKLLLLSTNFNKKNNCKMATSLVFNGSKITYRSLKL